MPLREIINKRLVSCSPDSIASDVADLMKSQDVGAVLVLENDKPVGIITDRDITVRCVAEGMPFTTPIRQLMTDTVEVVSANSGLQDVIRCMHDHKIRRVPVVDDSGKAVGLVSYGDIVGLLAKEACELSYTTPYKAA